MTELCYDTEFLDDGRTIELISIGIVRDNGQEYYAVNSDMPIAAVREHRWLSRNVLPHLPMTDHDAERMREYVEHPWNVAPGPDIDWVELDKSSVLAKPKWVIANEVREFLLDGYIPVNTPGVTDAVTPIGSPPVLWANYAAYDHVVLAQLWGPMSRLPAGIPMWTHDLQQLIKGLEGFEPPEQRGAEHDALADARHNFEVLRAARAHQADL